LRGKTTVLEKVYAGRRGTQTMLEKYTREGEEDKPYAGRRHVDAALTKESQKS
jgi:hypothetical protein